MGLLDGILSSVLGNLGNSGSVQQDPRSNAGGSPFGGMGGTVAKAAMIALALRLLQQNGGISGLIEKFRNSGLGQHASSWVSTGDNMPVGGHQLANAIGIDDLAQLASQFGLTPQQASDGLAQVLPEVVNQMTPTGEVPAGDYDEISNALATLQRRGVA